LVEVGYGERGAGVGLWARRGTRDEGRGTRGEGRGTRDEGRGTRDEGRGTRDEGRGTRDEGRGTRDEGRRGGMADIGSVRIGFGGSFSNELRNWGAHAGGCRTTFATFVKLLKEEVGTVSKLGGDESWFWVYWGGYPVFARVWSD